MARWLIVLAACGLTLATAVAVGQECPEIVAILPYGEPDVVTVDGAYAYFGIGRGLLVVDQSDPSDLSSVARLAMPATVRGIAFAAGRAYLSLGEDGLRVVDVSDPTDPRIVQAVDTPGEAQGVKVVGNLLFVAAGTAGLCAVSPTADPPVLGCVDTPQDARDVDVLETLAVVADGPGGLVVVSITDPAHMTVLGSAAMDARAVEAQGSLAFIAAGQAGLRVVDVNDPSSPVEVGQLGSGYGGNLDLTGSLVLLTGSNGYLDVVDVSTPSSPVLVGQLVFGGYTPDVTVVEDHATIAAPGVGVAVVDISQPILPTVVGVLREGFTGQVTVADEVAIVIQPDRLSAVDVSRPDRPREVSAIDHPAHVLAVDGPWLYLVPSPGWTEELLVVDLSDPSQPTQTGSLPLLHGCYSISAVGDVVHYIDLSGLHIVDVSDPTTPAQVSFVTDPTTQMAMRQVVAVRGHAYPCGDRGIGLGDGCGIVDVTDPYQPHWLATFTTAGGWEVRVDEHLLLAQGSWGGMGWTSVNVSVHDLSNPSEPAPLGDRVLFSGWYQGIETSVASHGGLLFASSSTFGVVRVIGLRTLNDPDAPDLAQATLPAPAGMAPMGRFLLVADTELGLVVLDTTCVGGLFADGFETGDTGAWSEAWP